MSDDPQAPLRAAFAANTYKLGVVAAMLGLSADASTDKLTAAARSLKAQIAMLRAQVEAEKARPPAPPPRLQWMVGPPDVPVGLMASFWCVAKDHAASRRRTRLLCYANGYRMPLSDSCDTPPAGCVPVGDDGDYAWTGWFEASCEQCETHWAFTGEVIEWVRLPKYIDLSGESAAT